jgi:hypothetical protein
MILATLISEVAGTDTRISGIIFLLLRRPAIFGGLSFFSILAKKNEKGKYQFKESRYKQSIQLAGEQNRTN